MSTAARLYYCDFLDDESRTEVPTSTLEHMVQRRHCRSEVDRLRRMLAGEGTPEQIQENEAVITAYLGRRRSVAT